MQTAGGTPEERVADGIGKVWTEVGAETVLLESSTGLSPADVGEWRACPVQPRPAGFRARGAARRGGARPFHDSQLRFDQIAKKNSNQGHRKTYNSLTRCLECQRPTAEATHVDPPPRDEYKARLAAAWAC